MSNLLLLMVVFISASFLAEARPKSILTLLGKTGFSGVAADLVAVFCNRFCVLCFSFGSLFYGFSSAISDAEGSEYDEDRRQQVFETGKQEVAPFGFLKTALLLTKSEISHGNPGMLQMQAWSLFDPG